jgi:CHASE2 domain-containing sensor protein
MHKQKKHERIKRKKDGTEGPSTKTDQSEGCLQKRVLTAHQQEKHKDSAEATQKKRSLLKRLLKAIPALLAAIILVVLFADTETYRKVEKSVLDFQMRRNMPTDVSRVAIVEITDADYYNFFQGISPLSPAKLTQAIDAIARGHPCVIGVDISTYDPPFKAMEIRDWWPPVIWVRDTVEDSIRINEKPAAKDVLGGKNGAFNENAGLALLIADDQGLVRRYKRIIETKEGRLPSFPWAVYQQSKKSCPNIGAPNLKESTEPLTINYSRGQEGIGRTRILVSNVLSLANSPEELEKEIKGKIVLLGGSYVGQDIHDTPLGPMPGVINMANAIETELRGGGWPNPPILLMVFLILFEGILVVLLFDEKRSLKKALLFGVPMILFVALACSLAAYGSLIYFPYFALIMVGVLVYQLIDRVKDYFKKHLRSAFVPEKR